MSSQNGSSKSTQALDSSMDSETKSRQTLRSSKDKKKRKSRSRVIKDEEDVVPNDPDYSPRAELIDEGSGEVSTSATTEEKTPQNSPPVIVYPNSGTICAFCYCEEKSLLGQGDLTRYDPTPGFNPFRKPPVKRGGRDSLSGPSPVPDDRSSKSPSRSRNRETRHSRDSTSRHPDNFGVDVVPELSMLGCQEIADPTNVFESTGHVTAHHCCAAWSEGVTQNELYQLLLVDKAVYQGLSAKCSYCSRYGATIKCKASRCDKLFHYPCAAGSGCFQDIKSMLMLCPNHLDQAPSIGAPEELNCAVCDDVGEISDFLFCTSCGHHYHGNCLNPDVNVNPVVRAGWQCPDCKICQTCRQPGDDNKMLVCDSCDKGYHTYCLEPAIPSIPSNGWCCQNCRRCVDCGKKATPNKSSIWNYSEEICDVCFQRQDKGHSCPVCGKGYPENIQHGDMMQCGACKKWVHDDCDDLIDMDAYDMAAEADYTCPKCRDEAQMDTETPQSENQDATSPMEVETPPVVVKNEEPTKEVKPAKRSSISSSLESDSSSAMKGSSTDPMLFASEATSSNKQRHISDETIAMVAQHVRTVVERKVSGDTQLGTLFTDPDAQDPLSLFSNEAFQPIVMLQGDDDNVLLKTGEEWRRHKIQPSEGKPDSKASTITPQRPGLGKPGSLYGKGKPFGSKKKPPASRSSKGKGGSKEKGNRANRRPRQGSTVSNASSTNAPSPGSTATPGQATTGQVATGMSMRRRTRARWNRQDCALGGGLATDPGHEIIDEEFGDSMHNTVVLCSADDAYTLNQDMCVVCGSFGQGVEGRLVVCSQCGQCYHPYCVNLKLTKVVLRKGWRCLDCTVCEECGAVDDPSHLLLCDDCDISYHTYCLKPPLLTVPKGGWKCKWCVRCTHCGTTSPGFNSDWAENYTSCGPCASLTHCPICRRSYRDEETIMQCASCERWLHSSCEYLYAESDIEKVLEKGYSCIFCRPKGSVPPHLDLNPPNAFEGDPASGIYLGRTRSDVEQVKEYHKDGVALTSAGLQHIQQLMQSAMGLNKKKPHVQKRKTQVQKQADKLSSPLDTKTDAEIGPNATSTELDGKDSVKDDESLVGLDLSQGGQLRTSALDPGAETTPNLDTDNDETLYKDDVVNFPDEQPVANVENIDEIPSVTAGQSGQVESSELAPLPVEGAEGPDAPLPPSDLTKLPVSGVHDGGIKKRRKPYRPGIGGFMVRQRNRGGFMSSKGRRNRTFKAVPTLPSSRVSSTTGFDSSPSKTEEMKIRASEITGECESNYIKHETEGGITIAHQDSIEAEMKEESNPEAKIEGQTSVLVSPLKLKISTLPPTQQPTKPKRKKRTRLIDQFPSYIQEGFFGNDVLILARSTKSGDIQLVKEAETTKRIPVRKDSQIVLPERVKLRLDTQVAMKAAEAKRKADMKQDRLHSRQALTGDDVGLMMDKESEDLLGVLPDDLPFKEDDILGLLSVGQGHGVAHESILSPSALESLVSDGLANIDGDVTSLFSDVLNQGQDGGGNDEHNLLNDIGNLTDPPKSSSAMDTMSTPLHDNQAAASSTFDVDPTDAIINQIAAEHSQNILSSSSSVKQEQDTVMMQQKSMTQHIQGQMQQQHMHLHQQVGMQQMQTHVQQSNFEIQSQIQTSVQAMNKHMFGEMSVSEGAILIPQPQQQQPIFVGPAQHPPTQQMPMQVEPQQQGQLHSMQQQKFISRHDQPGLAMSQNLHGNMSMPSPAHEHIQPHAILSRQHSMDSNPNQSEMQSPQTKVMAPTGAMLQMYGAQHAQGTQKQTTQPTTGMASAPISHSPGLLSKVEPPSSPMDQSGGPAAVSSLPDLTRDSNLFEPAPLPWPLGTDLEGDTLTVNQRNILKWEKDEPLGIHATISPVLYANIKFPQLKTEFQDWPTRAKQVAKLWRKATPEERAPFLQKARDNRTNLKSSRRDTVDAQDPDELEEDEKSSILQMQAYSSSHEGHAGPHGPEVIKMQQGPPQLPHQQQAMHQGPVRVPSTSPIIASDYVNFAKPKPPSRDPTPKPQSPGAAPIGGGRSKSPSSAFAMAPQQINPMAATQRPRLTPADHPAMTGQSTTQQQLIQGQQNWQNQQQVCMMPQHHGVRMPKMEYIDNPGMLSPQAVQFPQTFQPTHAQVQGMTGAHPGAVMNQPKPGPLLQRHGSTESPMATNQEQFILRPITPRPGMPPQLLPQVVSPVAPMGQLSFPQSPVSPHPVSHGMRTPGPKGGPPGTPQRDPFQEMEKPLQRWPSTSSDQSLAPDMHMSAQASQPSVTLRIPTSAEEGSLSVSSSDGSEKMISTPSMPGGRPQIREMLMRRTEQRRYKLLEQQAYPSGSWVAPPGAIITRPPPPYPSNSPVSTSQSSFVFSPEGRQERFSGSPNQPPSMNDSRIRGPRPQSLPPSPSFSPSFSGPLTPTHGSMSSFGVERFPSRTTTSSSVTGVHPISGQGGFIELRHSKHADAAIRREQLIRAGGALPVTTSDVKPSLNIAATSSSVSSSAPMTIIPKTEPVSEMLVRTPLPQTEKSTVEIASTSAKLFDVPAASAIATSTSVKTTASESAIFHVKAEGKATESTASIVVKTTLPSSQPAVETTSGSSDSQNIAGQVLPDPISSVVAKPASTSGEVDKTKSSEVPTEVVSSGSMEVPNKPALPSDPAEKTVDKSEESCETAVSAEHSYVRTSGTDAQDTEGEQGRIPPALVSRSISASSDGLIHGVGLTPPPDTSESISPASLEDGVIVSNVVIVGKAIEKEIEEKQKDETTKSPLVTDAPLAPDTSTSVTPTSDSAALKANEETAAILEVNDVKTKDAEANRPGAESDKSVADKQAPKPGSNSQASKDDSATSTEAGATLQPVVEKIIPTLPSVTVSSDSTSLTKDIQKLPMTSATPPASTSGSSSQNTTLASKKPEAAAETVSSPVPAPSASSLEVPASHPDTPPTSALSAMTSHPVAVSTVTMDTSSSSNATTVVARQVTDSSSVQVSTQDATKSSTSTTTVAPQFPTANPQSSAIPPAAHALQSRTLLIKEQPLLLQDLLDEEKKEQERAKLEKLSQEMIQQPTAMFPLGADAVKREVGMDRIMQAKMKVLSGITQVIQGATTQAGVEGMPTSGTMVQHPMGGGPWHQQPVNPHVMHPPDPSVLPPTASDADAWQRKARYEEWLFQHQALLQMQVKALEQATKKHRSTKQGLTKKQRQSKKSGEEFSLIDAQNLTLASKNYMDAQQQLDLVRKEQDRHSELVQTYNEKQRTVQPFMNQMPAGNQPAVVAQTGGEMVHMVQPSIPSHLSRQPSVPGLTTQQSVIPKKPVHIPVASTSPVPIGNTTVVPVTVAAQHSALPTPLSTQIGVMSDPTHQQQQQENLVAQAQKAQALRQVSPAEMQQFVAQQPGLLSMTSSISHSIHGGSESPKMMTAPSSAGPGQLQTQAMFPVSVNVRAALPGQLDPSRGQFIPAQVSSVNINTGSNMATKGPMVRPMHPGGSNPPPSVMDTSSFIHMQHAMGMGNQMKSTNLPQKEKKRKRKPKTSNTDNSGVGPRHLIAQGMTSPDNAASMGNVMHHFNAASVPLVHAHVATSLHTHVTSSPAAMVTTAQSHLTNLLHREGTLPQTPLSQPVAMIQGGLRVPTASPSTLIYRPDSIQHGQAYMKTSPHLMIAEHPVPVDAIKREMATPKAKVIKSGNSPHHPLTPMRLSGLTDAELDIIMATDPDARSTPTTPGSTPTASPSSKSTSGVVDDGGKPLKKEVLTDEESSLLIDETIATVIREGFDYGTQVELAKETGQKVIPPQWMRPPKPTKFPPKPPTPVSPMKAGQVHFAPGGFSQRVLSQLPLSTNHQELLRHMLKPGGEMTASSMGGMQIISPYGRLDKMEGDMNEQMKVQPDGSYMYTPAGVVAVPNKKKRSRGSSKDKDGKEKVKKKKKKKQQDEEDVFMHDPQRAMQANVAKHMHKGFAAEASGKQTVPWKPLPLLPLVEPDIKINYSMCMPKGTGLAQSKSLLEGSFGSATFCGLPDYYDLIKCKDPFVYMHPPTPPSSLPPSPKRDRLTSLDADLEGNHHVKVPDSLPTPPHQIPEMGDEFPSSKTSNDDIPPSSPEFDDVTDHFSYGGLHLLRVMAHKADSPVSQVPSPILPIQLLPEKDVDESDEVSVTISFKSGNSKTIKKSLSQLSRVLGTSIVSFKMEDLKKDNKKESAGLRHTDANKENKNIPGSQVDPHNPNLLLNKRRCFRCNELVVGNGVRRPLCGENLQEEDIIFCNKDCYFKHEFSSKPKQEPTTPKKKWKASQIYQRHTRKIDITSLISANPDPEHVSARGRSVSATPSGGAEGPDDTAAKTGDGKGRARGRRRGSTGPGEEAKAAAKRWKGIKWKKWTVSVGAGRTVPHKPPADVDVLLSKYGSALKPPPEMPDIRECVLCGVKGDGDTKGVARLLNLDVDQWVHLNCALWSAEVYETQGGALINVEHAVRNGASATCTACSKKGATIHCHRSRCTNLYHCACALECGCHFFKDKTVLCPSHTLTVGGQAATPPHHDQLKTLAVFRKVYVQRKETKQIASIMQQGELTQGEKNYILRVGALMFHAVGQLSTHQMAQYHSKSAIFPVGYKATRIYWSNNNTRKRCKYMCMISEKDGKPWFTTRYQAVASRPKTQEKNMQGEWMEMTGECVKNQWSELLQQLASLRSQQKMLKLFPAYINGENIFGLTSPVVCRILESLPNIELCANYKFRYGRSPILEVPLAINPTGCARSEPHIKHSRKKLTLFWNKIWQGFESIRQYRLRHLRINYRTESERRRCRPHTLISNLISEYYESTGVGDASASLYGKHFVHSKSSQYRRMKQDWRNNVNLARSRIQGLGLFASRDIDPGTMVIEYIGEIIRSEVAEKREKKYEAANRGVYMFRLDSDYIVDATVTGGPARYINHGCNPNCVAEVVNFEKEKKIMIISNRLILSGEELNYDYKFDFEDDGNKIPCLCGSINCRKWMN